MSISPTAYRFESELAQLSPRQRRDLGVFYTPWEVAQTIVRQVDQQLKNRFDLPLGLADSTTWKELLAQYPQFIRDENAQFDHPFVRILEPSAGSGIFLVAALRRMHENIRAAAQAERVSLKTIHQRWERFVRDRLPEQLHAIELMPKAILAARELVAQYLESTGLSGKLESAVTFHCGNALEFEVHQQLGLPATVILGNPPYAAASTNQGAWIKTLLRGSSHDQKKLRSYFHVKGIPLQERKLWLHDDYVKFLRVSQWHLEQAGCGVIGLVVNHGFLDNVTFRGLRFQLLDHFDQIEILDLNGNSKKRGTAARLSRDESVFDIGQGVAISILTQGLAPGTNSVRFGELWGPRDSKLKSLTTQAWSQLLDRELEPVAPHFFLVPRSLDVSVEYSQGVPVTELFPTSTSAVVTARDTVVIDRCPDTLLARIAEFRETKLSDDDLRAKYFPKPRSGKYPPGDTRGWKLSAAREALRRDPNWQERIAPCAYRPLDRRWIYWSSEMIDWPRGEVMEAMHDPNALGLVVRRQMPPDRPCNYFWVTNCLTVDGIVRSDNRGNETLIPMEIQGNENIERQLVPQEIRKGATTNELFAYVYALFHSSEYRTHFASMLQIEFPRVFFPSSTAAFKQLAQLGTRLITLHLQPQTMETEKRSDSLGPIASGYPKHRDGLIWIDRKTPLAEVGSVEWLFHVGSHQVLRKWLKDRRGSVLTSEELGRYLRNIETIRISIDVIAEIDQAIKKLGGLHRAFEIRA
ncbi:hypothetical protein GC197_18455 [bacterium]|nr:hypothetical protein [bacterium]